MVGSSNMLVLPNSLTKQAPWQNAESIDNESDNHILVTRGINVDILKYEKIWQAGIINLQMTVFSKEEHRVNACWHW